MTLLESGTSQGAYEAIARARNLDPSDPDTFEQYIELVHRWEPDSRKLITAKKQFASALAEKPHRHRDALDFAIPMAMADALAILANSPDAVARAGARVNANFDANVKVKDVVEVVGSEGPEISTQDIRDATLRVLLARGRSSHALARLSSLPTEEIPVASLRRAIHRAFRQEKYRYAEQLLSHLSRAMPSDPWVRDRRAFLRRVEAESERGRERAQLTREGYPFKSFQVSTRHPNRRRALYLLHNSLPYNSAGYATRTHGLLRGLHSLGWEVSGVTRPGYPFDRQAEMDLTTVPSSDTIDGIKYHRLSQVYEKIPRSPLVPFIDVYTERLGKLIRAEKPFLIHAASNHWNGIAAVQAAREHGLPSIYEVRGLWEITRVSREPEWGGSAEYSFMSEMEAEAARNATRVIAITAALREEMISRGVDPGKIDLVPNGVEVDRFVPLPRDLQLAAALGVGDDEPVIGYVGSVLDYEGIDLLLESVARLVDRDRRFKVLIVGDGDYLPRAKAIAARLFLNDYVIFTGRVPHGEVEKYYSLVDIAPLPRLPLPVCEMVSPLKPFEAMAMGKAVVASDVAALAEIVTDGVNGRLHRKGDAASLARVMGELLDDIEAARELGRQSRSWVVENRSWSGLATTLDSIYNELSEGR